MDGYDLHHEAVVLHCPGTLKESSDPFSGEWTRAVRYFFEDASTLGLGSAAPSDLTVVTYNTRSEPCLLERCCQRLGFDRLVVLGAGEDAWDWSLKITLVADFLRAGACETEYLLCLDGDDVLVISSFGVILDRYAETGADILFCSTGTDWPPDEQCRDFERSLRAPANHEHLNAGAYIGRTQRIYDCLRRIERAQQRREKWCFADHGFDDQLAWRHLHRHEHPNLRVDHEAKIFIRFDSRR